MEMEEDDDDDAVVGAVLASIESIIAAYLKEPCRTSALTGEMYYTELCTGNERRFQEQARMSKAVFFQLLQELESTGRVKSSRWVSAGEKILIALYILAGKSNRDAEERWQHSGETITRIVHEVIAAILTLQATYVVRRAPEQLDSKFQPYFDNCIGALDGTHVAFLPRGIDSRAFQNRKGEISQNVLAVCNFDLSFSFILAGWEGSAHDGRVLRDAWTKGLTCAVGSFFLGDAGYALSEQVLTRYRGVRYHLKEWESGNLRPQNAKELFNLRHSSLRNAVGRAFGVAKKRFGILSCVPEYSIDMQSDLVLASFILHNFIIHNQQEDTDFIIEAQAAHGDEEVGGEGNDDKRAASFRDEMAQKMWLDLPVLFGRSLGNCTAINLSIG